MLLLRHELARAHMREYQRQAELHRRGQRLVAARRWQRRAETASRRAHLALAAVS